MNDLIRGAEAISLFCRININTRKDLPIRSSEMGMLIYLIKSDNEATPIKIAEFFKVSKPMVTAMVNSLCRKGYLVKVPSSIDRRSITLNPTEKAIYLVEHTYAEYYKNLNILQEGLGKENYVTLVTLIEKANTILLGAKNNG